MGQEERRWRFTVLGCPELGYGWSESRHGGVPWSGDGVESSGDLRSMGFTQWETRRLAWDRSDGPRGVRRV